MHLFFLGAFLFGLLLAVFSMLHGVERGAPGVRTMPVDHYGRPAGPSRMALSRPVVAAFLVLFGATGYLLNRYSNLGVTLRLSFAVVAALVGVAGVLALIAKWAIPAAEQDVPDERYLLQGHLARVTTAISPGAPGGGQIAYEIGGTRYASQAQSVDGAPVAAGTDVVIERIEHGIAYVEPWVQVEQRI